MNSKVKITIIVAPIVCIVILTFCVLGSKQTESDCSKAEKFDSVNSKCVLKTSEEYANELAEIDTKEAEVKKEQNRRNGTECIPAEEARNYIGVTGCVRLGVYTSNHTYYGYGWLDSESSSSPTEFVVFAKNNVLTASDTNYYFNRIIEVKGTIESYEGKAQIEITNKTAIKDIGSVEEVNQKNLDTINEVMHVARCESYLESKQRCKEHPELCRFVIGSEKECGGYVSTKSDSLRSRRIRCYNESIDDAKNKAQKNSVYETCKTPSK